MFYKADVDRTSLRFGDVLQGYILASTSINAPDPKDYTIDIKNPDYCVILTPCCNIESGMVLLSPLVRVLSDFFINKYFSENLTRINRQMKPEQKFSKRKWDSFKPEKKLEIESKGKLQWSNLNFFIYDENPIFDEYLLKGNEIKYYMIDFRRTYRLKCPMIKRKFGEKEKPLLESKCLQLSDKTRGNLRNKLSYYFWRKPKEDE